MVESLLLHGCIRLSAPHCLQQLQLGASSSSSAKPLASTQESNGPALSGSVSSPQLPQSAVSSQVPAGPTRNVTGNVMPATLAEAATQLSFAEFLERCNLLIAPPPRPQHSPTLLLDAATQTSPHCAPSADATTQLPLTEFFLGFIYSKGPLDRSVPPPAHGNASSAPLPQPIDIATIYSPSSTSRTCGRHVCTTAPRARLHSAPPSPPGLEDQASLCFPHGIRGLNHREGGFGVQLAVELACVVGHFGSKTAQPASCKEF